MLDLMIDDPIACLPVCVGGCPDSCVTDNEVSVSRKINSTGFRHVQPLLKVAVQEYELNFQGNIHYILD